MIKMFRNLVGLEEEIEEEDIEEEEIEEARKSIESKPENKNSFTVPRPENKEMRKNNNQISRTFGGGTLPLKMVVTEPTSIEECSKLVDNLKAKKPIIINLEKAKSDEAHRIFDILNGAIYALNGKSHKISSNIILYVPENVDITNKNNVKSENNNGSNSKDKIFWR